MYLRGYTQIRARLTQCVPTLGQIGLMVFTIKQFSCLSSLSHSSLFSLFEHSDLPRGVSLPVAHPFPSPL